MREELMRTLLHGADKWKVMALPEYNDYFVYMRMQPTMPGFRLREEEEPYLTESEFERFSIPVQRVSKRISPAEVTKEMALKRRTLGVIAPIVVSCRIGIDMKHGVIGWDEGDGAISINEAIECLLRGDAAKEVREQVTMEEKAKYAAKRINEERAAWDEHLWDHVWCRVKGWFK